MGDPERRRWQNLLRALVTVVRQVERPDDRYTLSIRIAPTGRRRPAR